MGFSSDGSLGYKTGPKIITKASASTDNGSGKASDVEGTPSALGSGDPRSTGDFAYEMAQFAKANSKRAQGNLGGAYGIGDYLARGFGGGFDSVNGDLQRVSGINPELGYRGDELRRGRNDALGALESRNSATPAAMYGLAGRAGSALAQRAASAAGPGGALSPSGANTYSYKGGPGGGSYLDAMGNIGGATADSATKQNLAANEAYRRGIAERQSLEAKKAGADADMILGREKVYGKYMDMGMDDEWSRFQNALSAHKLQQQAMIDQANALAQREAAREKQFWGTASGAAGMIPIVGGGISKSIDSNTEQESTSDIRVKDGCIPDREAMEQWLSATPYSYELKSDPGKRRLGVMAQDMPKSMTGERKNGTKTVKADASTMLAGMAHLNQKIEALKNSPRTFSDDSRGGSDPDARSRNMALLAGEMGSMKGLPSFTPDPMADEENIGTMPLVEMDSVMPTRRRSAPPAWPRAVGNAPWRNAPLGYTVVEDGAPITGRPYMPRPTRVE